MNEKIRQASELAKRTFKTASEYRAYLLAAGLTLASLGAALGSERFAYSQVPSQITCTNVIPELEDNAWPGGPVGGRQQIAVNPNSENNRVEVITGGYIGMNTWSGGELGSVGSLNQKTNESLAIAEFSSYNGGRLKVDLQNGINYRAIFRTRQPGNFSFTEQVILRTRLYENMLVGNPNAIRFPIRNVNAEKAGIRSDNSTRGIDYGVTPPLNRAGFFNLQRNMQLLKDKLCTDDGKSQTETDRRDFRLPAVRPSNVSPVLGSEFITRRGTHTVRLEKGQILLVEAASVYYIAAEKEGRTSVLYGGNLYDITKNTEVTAIGSVFGGEAIQVAANNGTFTWMSVAQTEGSDKALTIADSARAMAGVRVRDILRTPGSCGLPQGCERVVLTTYLAANESLVQYDQSEHQRSASVIQLPLLGR